MEGAPAAGVTDGWLPPGFDAAVCFSVDDIHPGRNDTHYEAGGELDGGVLGRLAWLVGRHPALRVTLFVTPDWRELSVVPTRRRLAALPGSSRLPLARRLPRAAMRLDRHPGFVDYLRESPFELAVHGLYHFGNGHHPPREFEHLGVRRARRRVRRALHVFARAGLPVELGFGPPAWTLTAPLEQALAFEGYRWVSSGRDIRTAIGPGARTMQSGLRGVDLLAPQRIADGKLVHIPVNVQAPLDLERAVRIVELGGLVSVKAHATIRAFDYVSSDGLDDAHARRLDAFLTALEDRFGDRLWWASMGELAVRV